MRCLTRPDCERLAGDLGIDILDGGGVRFHHERDFASAQLAIPSSASAQALLTNTIFDAFGEDEQCLIWLQSWGVFSAEEYPEVWQAIRERYQEWRGLREAPGHCFSRDEWALARGMARLSLLFAWDAFLVTRPVRFIAFMSHDGVMFFYANDRNVLQDLSDSLARVDLVLVNPQQPAGSAQGDAVKRP